MYTCAHCVRAIVCENMSQHIRALIRQRRRRRSRLELKEPASHRRRRGKFMQRFGFSAITHKDDDDVDDDADSGDDVAHRTHNSKAQALCLIESRQRRRRCATYSRFACTPRARASAPKRIESCVCVCVIAHITLHVASERAARLRQSKTTQYRQSKSIDHIYSRM